MKAERKVLQKLLDLLHEIEVLEIELAGEDRVITIKSAIRAIHDPKRYRKLKGEKRKKEKEYNILLRGLQTIKETT